MVGIAGRSKACRVCRRRRVKCDYTQPRCMRCLKAGLSCEGYSGIRFVQYKRSLLPAPEETGLDVHALDRFLRPAHWHDLFFSCLAARFGTSHSVMNIHRRYVPRKNDFPLEPANSALIHESLLALGALLFGVWNNNREAYIQGMGHYGSSLRRLQTELLRLKPDMAANLVASICSLFVAEHIISGRGDTWHQHALGLEKVFMHYGPALQLEEDVKAVLEDTRPIMITAALDRRSYTLMSKQGWKASCFPTPSLDSNSTVLPFLMNAYAQITEFRMQKDRYFKTPQRELTVDDDKIFRDVLRSSIALTSQTRERFSDWLVHSGDVMSEVPPSLIAGTEEDLPWKRVYSFRAMQEAQIISLYHLVLILLLEIIKPFTVFGPEDVSRLASGFTHGQDFDSAPAVIQPRLDAIIWGAALDICRGVEYLIINFRETISSFFALSPMRVARRVLRFETTAPGRYLDSAFKIAIERRHLWHIAQALSSRWSLDREEWASGACRHCSDSLSLKSKASKDCSQTDISRIITIRSFAAWDIVEGR